MTPLQYLLLVSGMLAVALVVKSVATMVRAHRIAAVARKAGLQFSRPDRFDLSKRVALQLPVAGAAEVVVRDVIYSTTPRGLVCVMTASFTIGTMGHRRQIRRVCIALDRAGKELEHFFMFPTAPTPEAYHRGIAQLRQSVPETPGST